MIEQHLDVLLRERASHDERVADAPGVVLRPREVSPLLVLEMDVITDADNERPMSQLGPFLRPEGEQGEGANHEREVGEPSIRKLYHVRFSSL